MSSANASPRRVRVRGDQNRNICRRPDGKHEIGYRDSLGKQRWKVVKGGIIAARAERDAILGSKARGERVRPNPRLRFGETAERWLAEQVCDLRPSTQACYRTAVRIHLDPRWGRRRMDAIDVTPADGQQPSQATVSCPDEGGSAPTHETPTWDEERRTHGAQSDARLRQRMQECTPRGRRSRGSSISGVYRAAPHGNADN